ncbi:30S ribosomal protein S13 [subsurface metagenome]
MARISGVELPSHKKVQIGLSAIYGIGRPLADKILSQAKVNPDTRVKDLTEAEVNILRKIIEEGDYEIEGELRRKVSADISRLISIGSYRGIRHKRGLPVRGQRTRCNARTRKGPRRTFGTKKKTK